jgi:hypothetical protein
MSGTDWSGFVPMGRWVAEIRTPMTVTNNILLRIVAVKRDWFLEVLEK